MFTVSRCEYESDLRSNGHHFSSSENLNKACTGFEPMTSAIPVQRSIAEVRVQIHANFFFFFTGLNFFQALFSLLLK